MQNIPTGKAEKFSVKVKHFEKYPCVIYSRITQHVTVTQKIIDHHVKTFPQCLGTDRPMVYDCFIVVTL